MEAICTVVWDTIGNWLKKIAETERKRTRSYLQCDRGPDWGLIEHRHPFQTNQSDNQELQQQILDIFNTIQFKKYF